MITTRIVGTGGCVPDNVFTNDQLAERVDTSDEWIRTRTGIRERRFCPDDQVTSDIASEAANRALEAAGMSATDLDVLIVATVTPDMPMPSCAIRTQLKIGAKCPAFDISAACAGFTYGLTLADSLIRAGTFNNALLIGAETLGRYINWEDRATCVLFGDGAGAIVAVREDDPDATPATRRGILATSIAADGNYWQELNIRGGGSQHPPSEKMLADKLHLISMNGRAIFSQAVRSMSDACLNVLAQVGMSAADVDVVIPHQANIRIIDAIARRLEIPEDKLVINLDRYGNTSSASIPLALDEAVRDGRVKAGNTILMCGLGSGLTWGAGLIRW